MKGIALLVIIGIIALIAAGSTVGVSVSIAHNKDIKPDNTLYGLRKVGQDVSCTISSDKPACIDQVATERQEDALAIESENPELAEKLKQEAKEKKTEAVPNVPAFPE